MVEGDLWKGETELDSSQEVALPHRSCVYSHLVGPEKEDGDTFLVVAL